MEFNIDVYNHAINQLLKKLEDTLEHGLLATGSRREIVLNWLKENHRPKEIPPKGTVYKNPVPTVDIIINTYTKGGTKGIVLVERKNPPYGWALPGGFVDYGESLEDAAIREAKEETSVTITSPRQFKAYSNPERDPRQHIISFVFDANISVGQLEAKDDAAKVAVFDIEALVKSITCDEIHLPLAFDHAKIITEYWRSAAAAD